MKARSRATSVLVVDDMTEVRQALTQILQRTGRYSVAQAENPAEALQIITHDPPDVVITDISMPEQSGLSLIPEVLNRAPQARILVLSAHHGMEAEVLALGAHAFLPKITPPKKLLETLESMLSR